MFEREFTDGTITGLFALPVTLGRIALAKLIVYAIWVVIVSAAITVSPTPTLGLASHVSSPSAHSPGLWQSRQLSLTLGVAIAFSALTYVSWNRLQMNR